MMVDIAYMYNEEGLNPYYKNNLNACYMKKLTLYMKMILGFVWGFSS